MRAVVMQPTYLPWAGYFNLIWRSDYFIFLDDVQFERGSWQNRNRIVAGEASLLLSVPVKRAGLSQVLMDSIIDDSTDWRQKHVRTLSQSYSRKPFFDLQWLFEMITDKSLQNLADLNVAVIKAISDRLGLRRPFYRSSGLGIVGDRSARLEDICRKFGCDTYLSPVGSREYLEEDGAFRNGDVALEFQQYIPGPYFQGYNKAFVSHMSIVDVVVNLGWDASLEYVKTGADKQRD